MQCGECLFQILSWLTEEKRNGIKQAQAEGITETKKKGKHLGRPQINLNTLTPAQRNTLDADYPLWKNNELFGCRIYEKIGYEEEYIKRSRAKKTFLTISGTPFNVILWFVGNYKVIVFLEVCQ